jgi:2-oxoisovalerate dehydrogenase E2 component (dihydrolipoyl transacylase)
VSQLDLKKKPLLSCTGIRECEIIQWFVEGGARVEEFDKICEVQSDKASVEITSRFSGVIKKLHYESGEMAIVGKPLVDIDTDDSAETAEAGNAQPGISEVPLDAENPMPPASGDVTPAEKTSQIQQDLTRQDSAPRTDPAPEPPKKGTHATLATPAIRHLTKELGVSLEDIHGTGRDGRVLKEDVYKFVEAKKTASSTPTESPTPQAAAASTAQEEKVVPLTNIQHQMFKAMTASLKIPHFLYADEIDFTSLSSLRQRLNSSISSTSSQPTSQKLSYLPFILKALSLALHQYPILNSRIDVPQNGGKPSLVYRPQHNIGVAMDTPQGLLVPVIKNLQTLSISEIAAELARLQSLASQGQLSTSDLSGGTITVSNIGSIGGTYVSPVIVEGQVAILGIGKVRDVPAWGGPDGGELVRKRVCHFSWSADHRVVDGATVGRAGECVRGFVERPEGMVVALR